MSLVRHCTFGSLRITVYEPRWYELFSSPWHCVEYWDRRHEVSINPFVALFMAARFKCVWRHPQLRLPTTATGETQSWRPNASNYWSVIVRSCTFGASLSGLALSTSAIWSVIVSQVRHFQRPHSVNNIQCESKKLSPEVLWNFSLQRTQRSAK